MNTTANRRTMALFIVTLSLIITGGVLHVTHAGAAFSAPWLSGLLTGLGLGILAWRHLAREP